jgi:hypothetical protein
MSVYFSTYYLYIENEHTKLAKLQRILIVVSKFPTEKENYLF